MNKVKSIWTSITGSISSIVPLFFACCKSGACVGVCASPIASLFGISTAGFASSPILNLIEPILIALSAISFTVSYYSIYVLPKFNACNTDCNCDATPGTKKKEKLSKAIFWIGLIAGIFFFTYFEIQKYQANQASIIGKETECCSPTTNDTTINNTQIDTLKSCCGEGETCE